MFLLLSLEIVPSDVCVYCFDWFMTTFILSLILVKDVSHRHQHLFCHRSVFLPTFLTGEYIVSKPAASDLLTSLMSLFPTMVLNSLRSLISPLRMSAIRFLWWLLTSWIRDSSASRPKRWACGRRAVNEGVNTEENKRGEELWRVDVWKERSKQVNKTM